MQLSTIFITTDADSLYFRLEKNLFREGGSFRQLVIVPHELVGKALSRRLLSSGLYGGIKILELSSAVDYLTRVVRFEDKKGRSFPSPMLFSLHLESILGDMLSDKRALFDSLRDYVFIQKEEMAQQKRIRELAEALSLDFLHYGVYGGEGLSQWLRTNSWKVELWNRAFTLWDYPYHAFKELSEKKEFPTVFDIHLFGFEVIPIIYEGFFAFLAGAFPCFSYFLTPSKMFWGEALSDREFFYKKRAYEKRGISQEEISLLREYQNQEHPILINFGKVSKERLNTFMDLDVKKEEFFYPKPAPKTFLEHVQVSLFEGEFSSDVVVLDENDSSIKLHACATRKREVEVLLKQIMKELNAQPIEPSQILVLAPDISIYAPYIEQIFGEQSPFSFEIHGLPVMSQSPFLQGMWALLTLLESRCEKEEVFAFLHNTSVQKKWNLKGDEIKSLKILAEKASLTWGLNQTHRGEILKTSYNAEGSWLHTFYKILLGLVVFDEKLLTPETACFYPCLPLEKEEGESVAKAYFCIRQIASLREEVIKEKQTLEAWVEKLRRCADTFFDLSLKDPGVSFFYQQLKGLEQLSLKVKGSLYYFSSLKNVFEKLFSKKGAKISSSNQNAIVFASLAEQQLYPVECLYFLGMEEGSFPLKEPLHPLREIERKEMDACPSGPEMQRQLLLDAFLYSKTSLSFSFCFFDEGDGKEKQLSFLVRELFETLEPRFTFLSSGSFKKIITRHKTNAFHHEEIDKEGCFSLREIRLAEALYNHGKVKRPLLKDFYEVKEKNLPSLQSGFLNLKELEMFARNPLKNYLQKTLSIHVKKEKSKLDDKEFALSYLDRALFQKELLSSSFDVSFLKREARGGFPLGLFAKIAKEHLEEEKRKIEECFDKTNIDIGAVFSIELSMHTQRKKQVGERKWLVPALMLKKEEKTIFIEGMIEYVSDQGLLFFGEDTFADFVKIWPSYLVFCLIQQRDFREDIFDTLVLLKSGKVKKAPIDDLEKALLNYLDYYKKAAAVPSPLHPEWAETFLLGEFSEKKEVIYKSFTADKSPLFVDDYQKWVYEHMEPFSMQALDHHWGSFFKDHLSSLAKWSQSKKTYG